MPQPLKDGEYADFSWQAVLRNPTAAQYIGALTVEWSGAEAVLAWYYGTVLYGGIPEDMDAWDISARTFESVLDFNAKRNLLIYALNSRHTGDGERVFPEAEVKEFTQLLDLLAGNKALRVRLAHGRWGYNEDYPDCAIWKKTFESQDPFRYTIDELRQALERLTQCSQDLHNFFMSTLAPRIEKFFSKEFVKIVLSLDAMGCPNKSGQS